LKNNTFKSVSFKTFLSRKMYKNRQILEKIQLDLKKRYY
jgi:hypothetical protein